MISLIVPADIRGAEKPFVVRLTAEASHVNDAVLRQTDPDTLLVTYGRTRARLNGSDTSQYAGDVVLLDPERAIMHRLIRAKSRHNTFVVTERCDQLCVMCSQPPKKTHFDNFEHFEKASQLAPTNAVLGFSGGEPTLYKDQLFGLLERVHDARPDLRFHVLTNGQHFTDADIQFFSSPAGRKVQWGVPLYAADRALHDSIVGKIGAFERLQTGLAILGRSGAQIELRTVLTRMNSEVLTELAHFIARFVPFAAPWAIMQLERIGFAKNRWNELFFDNSVAFDRLAEAIDIARVSDIPVLLYNFPLCTVPPAYRALAPATISDWKNKFLPECDGCKLRTSCSGFFEWHSDQAYLRLERQ
ncbi:His-Xaa-Ser system radical SAM maturase HxsC [Devosia sp. Leaf64]|uniref:His-Xaa-Ser system radical SAM maturase HxsC n=1 Tax=Devosia sp. Leaf64 TaxID=1736229 RepID=UPI0007163673|nr:His-Xaa-Ser system radical SAM maturase HxsC [Devosia sp. Leaf64]KQN77496.1 hypothetical protein ASE94_15940 [Devosia sp. Leaf64]